MKTLLTLLTTVSAIVIASGAYAADASGPDTKTEYNAKDNGGYDVKAKSSMTTNDGTDKMGNKEVNVDVDNDGTTTKTSEAKSSSDAKGLMNKKTHKMKTKIKKKADGSAEVKKMDDATDAAGTNTSTEAKTDVDVKDNGDVEATTESKEVVDPKGLFNKKTVKMKTKTVNGEVVDQSNE